MKLYLVWHILASPLTVRALVPLLVLSLTPTGGGQPRPFGVSSWTMGRGGGISLALQLNTLEEGAHEVISLVYLRSQFNH